MAYIEIDSGPYLVMPKEKAFDKGERPVNIVPSNLVWLKHAQTSWITPHTSESPSPEIAFLWGNPSAQQKSGSFLRLPNTFKGEIKSQNGLLRIVVVKGQLNDTQDPILTLSPGEFFTIKDNQSMPIQTEADNDCTLYIHADGAYTVTTAE
ncbi:DUF4437 domain-containing protein [Rubritalea tangerina]|uniref:DUF4437 domain-containing protein n=1 Tax=Rubritalea tangerina TaxID=430798 RepID=A0ABW4Z7U1_9BACT